MMLVIEYFQTTLLNKNKQVIKKSFRIKYLEQSVLIRDIVSRICRQNQYTLCHICKHFKICICKSTLDCKIIPNLILQSVRKRSSKNFRACLWYKMKSKNLYTFLEKQVPNFLKMILFPTVRRLQRLVVLYYFGQKKTSRKFCFKNFNCLGTETQSLMSKLNPQFDFIRKI